MSERNMTQIRVDGYRYTVSLAAKNHIHEVLAAYVSSKKALPVAKASVEPAKAPEPDKKQRVYHTPSSPLGKKEKKGKKK